MQEKLMQVVRDQAEKRDIPLHLRFSINSEPNKTYSMKADKDGLSRKDRNRIEAIKEEKANPMYVDLF